MRPARSALRSRKANFGRLEELQAIEVNSISSGTLLEESGFPTEKDVSEMDEDRTSDPSQGWKHQNFQQPKS